MYSTRIQQELYGTKYGLFDIVLRSSLTESKERYLSDQEIIEHIIVGIYRSAQERN